MLIDGLPDDSRLTTVEIDRARDELRPAAKKGQPMATVRWGPLEHLVADLRDLIVENTHAMISVANAQSGNAKAQKPPKPLPRPTDPRLPAISKQVAVHKRLLERFADKFIKRKSDDGADVDKPAAAGLSGAEEGDGPVE